MKILAVSILSAVMSGMSDDPLWAQIEISQSQMQAIFNPGGSFRSYSSPESLSVVDVGPAGGPSIYDFSNIPFSAHPPTNVYAVSQVPYLAGHYPDDGITWGESTSFIEQNPILLFRNDTIKTIGEAFVSSDSQMYRHHRPHDLIAVFPARFGDTLFNTQSPGSGVETTYVSNSPVRVTTGWNSSGTSIFDGYGTLKVGGRELECLRIRSVEVSPYAHKGFTYLTREGLVLIVESTRDQPDSGPVETTGIFYLVGGSLLEAPNSTPLPTQVHLFPNYPNPFNPSTTIRFTLERSSHVMLTIFNTLGEASVILANEQRPAGSHEITWEAAGYPSGPYFFRLVAENHVTSGKLMLMK